MRLDDVDSVIEIAVEIISNAESTVYSIKDNITNIENNLFNIVKKLEVLRVK